MDVGVGQYRLVSIYPARLSQLVNGDKGVFYSECMFDVILVTHSLERHDNFFSLLGTQLFSCRSVRYILPLLPLFIFTDLAAYTSNGCGHVRYVLFLSSLDSTHIWNT